MTEKRGKEENKQQRGMGRETGMGSGGINQNKACMKTPFGTLPFHKLA